MSAGITIHVLSFTEKPARPMDEAMETSNRDLVQDKFHHQPMNSFPVAVKAQSQLHHHNWDWQDALKAQTQPHIHNWDWQMLSIQDSLSALSTSSIQELPSVEDFICILQKCRKQKNPVYAKRLHDQVCFLGLEAHSALENYIVPMFVECGSLSAGEQAFNRMSFANEHSWVSLMQGCIEVGELQRSLYLYQNLLENVGITSRFPYIAALKACSRLKCIKTGDKIYIELVKDEFETDLFVGSSLVDMYTKCGALAEAQEVFNDLESHDMIAWTTLIAGYTEQGYGNEALTCLEQMKLESVPPDAFTYICSLKACGITGAICKGRQLHALAFGEGFKNDIFVGSALVDMYSKCASLSEAQRVFDELPIHDVVSWTALLVGYSEHGFGEEALSCFKHMQMEGVIPDPIMYACSLKACGSVKNSEKGQEIHSQIIEKGLERDCTPGNMLVEMYTKCGLLEEAWSVFETLAVQDTASWNTLVAGCLELGLAEESLNCVEQMQQEGLCPNDVTYICGLKACGSLAHKESGQTLHSDIVKRGFEKDIYIGNNLVVMLAKCGSLMEARDVFDKLAVHNVVSWDALIICYTEYGLDEEAVSCFKLMTVEGTSPDPFTFSGTLKACGSLGAIHEGQTLHSEIVKVGYDLDMNYADFSIGMPYFKSELSTVIILATSLIDMYAKCGSIADAWQVFDAVPIKDRVIWNTMTTAWALQGNFRAVLLTITKMEGDGFAPNDISFLGVLNACSHAGLPDEGRKYFDLMREQYGIVPSIKHYTCMIDILGRAGQVDEAVAVAENMPFVADSVLWSTVLGACQKWANIELGRCVFTGAAALHERHSSMFVLMSNMFADTFWDETESSD